MHNLYKNQVVVIRVEQQVRKANIRKEVRLECKTSPLILLTTTSCKEEILNLYVTNSAEL